MKVQLIKNGRQITAFAPGNKAGGFLGQDYIEKPFKVPELKERIDKILKK